MPMLWDGLKLLAAIAVLYGIAALFVLQESYLSTQFERERAAQHALLGDEVASFAETRASNLFTRLAVNSGALRESFDGLQPPRPSTPTTAPAASASAGGGGAPASTVGDPGTGNASSASTASASTGSTAPAEPAQQVTAWTNQRMRVIWTILFFTLVRLSYALLWWPFFVISLVPAIVDAIALRKIQSTTFALTSPQLQGFVMRALPLTLVAYFLWVFGPFYEHPLTVPVGIAVTTAMLWLGVVQFAKRG